MLFSPRSVEHIVTQVTINVKHADKDAIIIKTIVASSHSVKRENEY